MAITFLVPGQSRPAGFAATRGGAPGAPPAGLARGVLKHSISLGARRGAGAEARISAEPGRDVVVLHLANGPSLVLHPENARDLMLAQRGVKRSRGATAAGQAGGDEVRVPLELEWRGLEEGIPTRGAKRGFLGEVVLSAIEVVTGVGKESAADFAATKVVELVDAQVDEGVYVLNPGALPKLKAHGKPLAQVPPSADGGPLLVFVHGTFSETNGTFGALWTQHPHLVRSLFQHYGQRVYALEHRTLGASPIENALSLARALPDGARLHLVTHSRGGLVGEVLARVCAPSAAGPDPREFFEDAALEGQRAAIDSLVEIVRARGIRVERVVRVACPARGTLLASKRLDAYLSVFKWTIELAGIPVAPALIDFLAEVAQRRADPALIPGLAAQIPASPLVQWLHAVDEAIPGDLRVLAGDMEGDSVTSWLKTLLADAYYWTDNDLVVQTRSMYGGAPRAAGATFLLDQGAKVSHFGYFRNERTAEAIVSALVQEVPQGFRTIGPLSWSGESATGVRGLRAPDDGRPAFEKPAVFLLPGILGSNLKVGGKRIWLGWRLINGLNRLEYRAGQPDGVEPDGPMSLYYEDLAVFLARTHEVIEFAYDWRRPMEEEAKRLATAVEAALDARRLSGQPVRFIAHSMGGLVARILQLECPALWERVMSHPGARLLMLGTPNNGSWAPMQVLSGDDTFGNTLVAFGAPFQDHKARALMARFPGFIQLQAELLDAQRGLAQSETWQQLAEEDLARVREHNWWHSDDIQLTAYKWGTPPQDVLDRAVALRRRLDAQRDAGFGVHRDKLLLVVGNAPFTPDGFEVGEQGLVYLDVQGKGDGRVTLQGALLPGVRTWKLDCEHGGLPDRESAFDAYLELLERGDTLRLERLAEGGATRGAMPSAVSHVRSRPARTRAGLPPQSTRELLSLPAREAPSGGAAPSTALCITVVNGNLKFVRLPLVLGHYRAIALTGTESVIDRLVGGTLSQSLAMGAYPDLPGSQRVFINLRANAENPLQMPRPEAVIVVGLGAEGSFQPSNLVYTVRQGVVAWAQRLVERSDTPLNFELAATLIGSGGSGVRAGHAAQLIAQGVREANERLAAAGWPRVSHLHLVELYLDRATEAWAALQVQATAMPGHYALSETVQAAEGALPRPIDAGYRGADYDLITAVSDQGPNGEALVAYTLDTRRARSEMHAQATQGPLLEQLVIGGSNDWNRDAQIGRTLFQLLVPLEMEPFLGGTTEMVLELDERTAAIPWELLDTYADAHGGGDSRPWAIRCKLLRKLRTDDFRARVVDANAESHVLVIGEPACDHPRLPGARAEAIAVAECFRAAIPGKVKALVSLDGGAGADAVTVTNAVLERDWRVVHIAGHGELPESGGAGGVVLSNKCFLGPSEINNMRVVPELVFINCCHLAAFDPGQLAHPKRYDRPSFAAGVARRLIAIGVRCVVAAGWAVEDGPAKAFATNFYGSLLRGSRFIDAVAEAREAARELGGNTWAAYQCYGDPNWYFEQQPADAQRPTRSFASEFAAVASAHSLQVALETLTVSSRYDRPDRDAQLAKIRYLETRFAPRWGAMGAVAEAFGAAYAGARDVQSAVGWYDKAMAANDGGASLRAVEQLGNLRARVAAESVAKAQESGMTGVALDKARGQAQKDIAGAIELLERLVAIQPTIERHSLCGSAYKRLALIEDASGSQEQEAALAKMKLHYGEAEKLARAVAHPDGFYPALNRMAAELAASAVTSGNGFSPESVAAVRKSLVARAAEAPDFWSVAGLTELRLYEAIAGGSLAAALSDIDRDFADLHGRVSAAWMWSSVYDQATLVLPRYAARAPESEKIAASTLLASLRKMAGHVARAIGQPVS